MLWRLSTCHPELFPDPELAEPSGLLAVGGDLTPHRLVVAYCSGIFPWYNVDSPILWWSPDPRCVIEPSTWKPPSRLARTLRSGRFRVTRDTCFARVIRRCASIRRVDAEGHVVGGTWLVPEMIVAYERLHDMGLAHSVEAWVEEGGEQILAGGLYGVELGKVFFGESMFHERPDGSKAALAELVTDLAERGIGLLDCQMPTPHLMRMGARLLDRREFLARVREGTREIRRSIWLSANRTSASQKPA
ncbi:MAG TPA: leucyl/phenylalanyl-tRNA--protein transferase [Candidatus Avidesulfovibrio excrementigallinarum]|nr:leucyl/phenylalanyl-tRNA--protein transferase [Candidatus Avidesulfovibrio excrementigallinarum]